MKTTKIVLIGITAFTLACVAAWPFLAPHAEELRGTLLHFRRLSRYHPGTGYAIYSAIFVTILLLGLPLATAVMLLAGVTYSFWEGTALVTACRMGVAVAVFLSARHLLPESDGEAYAYSYAPKQKPVRAVQPAFLQRFRGREGLYIFLMRIMPLPDNVVNYTMGISGVDMRRYAFYSLAGILPVSILFVWLGSRIGSVTALLRWLGG